MSAASAWRRRSAEHSLIRPRSPAGAASARPSPWPQIDAGRPGADAGLRRSRRSTASVASRLEPIGSERAGEPGQRARPARREAAPGRHRRAQAPRARRCRAERGDRHAARRRRQHQALDPGGLDRRNELPCQRADERPGRTSRNARAAGRDGGARAAPAAGRRSAIREKRRVVDVGREDEPQPVDAPPRRRARESRDAERAVAPLPDPRPSGAGRGAERDLEHAAAGAARRVAAPDRVGEDGTAAAG